MKTLDEIAGLNCRYMTFMGGKYFLYPKWKDLLAEAAKRKITTNIISNGWMVNEDVVDFMKTANLDGLGISIDGGTAQTHDYIRQVPGMFDRAFRAVDAANRKQLAIGAITTINKLNITELKQLRDLLLQHNTYLWQLQHASLFGRMKEELSLDDFEYYISGLFIAQTKILYEKQMRIRGMHCCGYYSKTIPQHAAKKYWTGCLAGHHALGIRSDGKVFGCLSLYDDKYIEGDLNEKSLTDIIADKNFCSWNKRFEKFKHRTGVCTDCPYAFLCLSGCTSFSHDQAPKCYHAIEDYYAKHLPANPFETLFKSITNGHMDKQGQFFLSDGTLLTFLVIDKLNIADRYKDILRLIALS